MIHRQRLDGPVSHQIQAAVPHVRIGDDAAGQGGGDHGGAHAGPVLTGSRGPIDSLVGEHDRMGQALGRRRYPALLSTFREESRVVSHLCEVPMNGLNGQRTRDFTRVAAAHAITDDEKS